MQVADIKVLDRKAGKIEIAYLKKQPELDEGPFMKEERRLIISIAERLGKVVGRIHAEEELKSVDQHLRASNQQLDAANQQLKASEQQLRSSNQQLDASNQQLDAANQQRRANEQELNQKKTVVLWLKKKSQR